MLELYQKLRLAAEADYPEELDADYICEQFGEACNCLLRALHEVNPQAYLDCSAWDASRLSLEEPTP